VARLGDGWVASAYNTTPDQFRAARERLADELARRGSEAREDFPHALVTMWLWVTDDDREASRMIDQLLAPMLRRDPAELRERVCIGSAEQCADLLGRYAEAGCIRTHVWPLGDEAGQLERLMGEVLPRTQPSPPGD
jgi:alkanesulfonate monooxygenase SsuD/methylene tetrahydromethanopterin reductase-like flavin-dependent oxidoreductase (luciferase family)